jgi:D-amino-acid dehydrogenase
VAGATRETGSGFDYRITPAGLAEILEQALAVAPGLADGTYLETRVGFRPMGRTSGRCSDQCPGWTAWSSPPAWAPRS